MPRKKKLEEPIIEETEEDEAFVDVKVTDEVMSEPSLEELEPPKDSDKVKVKVTVGTLSWERGTFEKGETFETTYKRAKQFGGDVTIVT